MPTWSRSRPVVCGRSGAVASAHPLATLAGFDTLRAGGNAVDAVVATAVALGVVEPYMSGPGGVGLLLLHRPGHPPTTLNFTGVAPAAATPDKFNADTQTTGIRASMVPGNVAGWFEMLRKHGTLSAEKVFAPAIQLARDGFPLHPFNAWFIRDNLSRLNAAGHEIFDSLPLQLGAILRQPQLADSLEQIARRGPRWFYEGDIGQKIAAHMQAEGGLITAADLARYEPAWEEPIGVEYRGRRVLTCPPNCEGFQILQTLKLLEGFDLAAMEHNGADYLHLVSEAVKLAVADRIRYAGDPKFNPVPLDRLLDPAYCADRRQLINPDRASNSEGERWRPNPAPDAIQAGNEPWGSSPRASASRGSSPPQLPKPDGMTTHLSAVDAAGNVASITQSLGHGFGSGVFVPGTGIALNSFCYWSEIDPRCPTPNLIAPGKRWACCMSPVQVFNVDNTGDKFWFSVSTPGSYGILHTTLQMLLNVLDFAADPQAAIEAPRFRLWEDTRMQIETRVPPTVREELTRRGHALELLGDWNYYVGGGQSVMIDPASGARMAAADPRRDGYALAY